MQQSDQKLLYANKIKRGSYFTNRTSGFVEEQKVSGPIRFLKTVDLFSFLPVPTDQPVSTKKSLLGTAFIIVIFLSYMIYDFAFFLFRNPGIPQVYYSRLDNQKIYDLPRFSTTFMFGNQLNKTELYEQYLQFNLTQQVKNPGQKYQQQVDLINYTFRNDSQSQNIQYLEWLNHKLLNFYSIQRIPSQNMSAKGLLYSTDNATYTKLLISLCNSTIRANCKTKQQISVLLAGGRIFLFIQDKKMQTSIDIIDDKQQNQFLLYNFFLIPGFYKRVNIKFRVENFIVEPDYFWRWSEQVYFRIKVNDINEQFSDVSANFDANTTALETLGINMILHPEVMNTRISFVTLIDHVSKWGALWGVLFAVFAFIFLSYNRNKYYRKNPQWQNFKQHLSQNNKINANIQT